MSLDVSPRLTGDDSGNRPTCYAKLARQRHSRLASCRPGANLQHSRFGQHGMAVTLAPSVTRLAVPVAGVLRAGSEEQVIGADARLYVAAVADEQAIRNRAVVQLPRVAVRADAVMARAKAPVSSWRDKARPQPTVAALVYARPKSLLSGNRRAVRGIPSSGAWNGAEHLAVRLRPPLLKTEGGSAMQTLTGEGVTFSGHGSSSLLCRAGGDHNSLPGFLLPLLYQERAF